jgi:hypothetical protein
LYRVRESEVKSQSTYAYPVFQIPFAEEAVLSPIYVFDSFVEY